MKLSAQTKRAHDRIISTYVLSADGLLVLQAALQSYDDYMQARAIVQRDGLIGKDGKRHPAHDVQVNSYRNFLAGMRHLGLDAQPESAEERENIGLA
jgi:phage terminase small subunit